MAFAITRIVGIYKDSEPITDTAFDILSLEALFMVPRSVASTMSRTGFNIVEESARFSVYIHISALW